jgi:pectin methylesterase-like acyl-CoA thioesterase
MSITKFNGSQIDNIQINSISTTNDIEDSSKVYFLRRDGYWSTINKFNTLYVSKPTGDGVPVEFESIAAAVDSITDASASNPYIVNVSAGTFTEPVIIMKPYVKVVGTGFKTTTIQAVDPNATLIYGAYNTEIEDISITGVTGSVPAVLYTNNASTSTDTTFIIKDVAFGNNYLHVRVYAEQYASIVLLDNCYFGNGNSFQKGFEVANNPTYNATTRLLISKGMSLGIQLPYPTLFGFVSGTNTEALITNLLFNSNPVGKTGTFIQGENGASIKLLSINVRGFDKVIHLANNGSATKLVATAVSTQDTNHDVYIEDPNALGTLEGVYEHSKVYINPSSKIYLHGKDRNIITVSKVGGDFKSVKSAIDSITDASATNKYIVKVGPGIFEESTITLKQHVTILGENYITSIIQAVNPDSDLIIAVPNANIFNVMLTGATATNRSLVVYNGGGLFRMDSVRFGTGYHYMKMGSTVATSIAIVTRCSGDAVTSANTCFYASDNGTNPVQLLIEYFVQNGVGAGEFENFAVAHGVNTLLGLNIVSNIKTTGTGVGVNIYNGTDLRLSGCNFQGFNTSIKAENIGAAPKISIIATSSTIATTDISLEHPSTNGSINGSFSRAKVFVDPSITDLSLMYSDPDIGGTITLGEYYIGDTLAELVEVSSLIQHTPTMGVLTGGKIVSAGTADAFEITIQSGYGYLSVGTTYPGRHLKKLTWNDTNMIMTPNTTRYIFFNSSGILSSSSSQPSSKINIVVGRVVADTNGIELIDNGSLVDAYHAGNNHEQFNRSALGAVYQTGSIVTANTSRQIAVTAGTYYFGSNRLASVNAASPVSFTTYYHAATSGQWTKAVANVIPNSHYDNESGTLVPLTAGYFVRHSLYIMGNGADTKYMMVYGQIQYPTLVEAEGGVIPSAPSYFTESIVLIASLIAQQGNTTFLNIRDERPTMSFKSSGTSASASHGNLLGLEEDDHTQYLLGDGSRAMVGSLDMGGNSITNVNLVDGLDISTHVSRHLPNGLDALATGAAVSLSLTTVNSEGIANSFSRADHTHAISIATANSTTTGMLSSADWNTFNSKLGTAGGTITGATVFSNTTNATSLSTGAVRISGGMAVSLSVMVGNDIEIINSANGLILKASNGTRYRVTIDTDGALITTAL